MVNTHPTPIKEILGKTVEAIKGGGGQRISREEIVKAWKEVAGEEASRHSFPARFNKGILVVSVDSPIWIYQLNIKKKTIERRLNGLFKQETPITIRLRAGER